MSFVDVMGDHQWTPAERRARTEAIVESQVPASTERILTRRTLGFLFYVVAQMLPAGHPLRAPLEAMGTPLTPEAAQELMAAAAVFAAADAEATQADNDIALLERVLAAESGTAELDPADAQGLALLAQRAEARPKPEPGSGPTDEGNTDGQEGSMPADSVAAGA